VEADGRRCQQHKRPKSTGRQNGGFHCIISTPLLGINVQCISYTSLCLLLSKSAYPAHEWLAAGTGPVGPPIKPRSCSQGDYLARVAARNYSEYGRAGRTESLGPGAWLFRVQSRAGFGSALQSSDIWTAG